MIKNFSNVKNFEITWSGKRPKKIKKIGRWYHEMREMGSNYRLSDIQAALGLSQLKRIRKFVLRRNYIAKYYDKVFGGNEFFTIPKKEKIFSLLSFISITCEF